ncbi:caspase 21, apoptosis-related cysteine peptidase [Engraulis encrasicolus]|uniref:caspase 21, apoptosis-related cysteine peptidase n=1 Tax=Engraulis encrasicolus TaxID=184585 RepID=UPI002FCE8055
MADTSHEVIDFSTEYSREHQHIGKCLIINNENFTGQPHLQRFGTEVDGEKLRVTFRMLGFNVRMEKDLSAADMKRVLHDVSEEDHSDKSCFVCVLLSHGEPALLMGADGASVPIRMLASTLSSQHCHSLRGKPKLFFIQACRGQKMDAGVETDSTQHEDDLEEEFAGVSEIPEEDFLCFHSTSPSYYSWRNQLSGSVFIDSLCNLLTHHRKQELIKILTRVSCQVATTFHSRTSQRESHGKRQMPCIISRLTKEFYFRKKH